MRGCWIGVVLGVGAHLVLGVVGALEKLGVVGAHLLLGEVGAQDFT